MKSGVESLSTDVSSSRLGAISKATVRRFKWVLPIVVFAGAAMYGWQNGWYAGTSKRSTAGLVTFQVEPRDLPITVIERGQLVSQSNLPVFCEVDDYRSDGINGTTIIWITPNGTSVSKLNPGF